MNLSILRMCNDLDKPEEVLLKKWEFNLITSCLHKIRKDIRIPHNEKEALERLWKRKIQTGV